jgi:single-strand DNA-binding protein
MWGQRAESLAQYLTKGKKVAAWGTMRQERWDQEGVQRMKVVLTADGLEFTGSAENGSGRTSERTDERNYGQGAENRSQTPPRQTVGNSAQPAQAGNQADDLFTDDIPF